MRGKVKRNKRFQLADGITPAYAGKRPAAWAGAWRTGDHPRVCGEKGTGLTNVTSPMGSPPRMRGKGLVVRAALPARRITPAYAGKSRAVIGGGHALHNGRGDLAAQGADGVGALRRGLWCGACQQCGHQCGGGGDLLCKCHVLCSFAFQVCPGGLPGLWGGAALFERCDPARASA